MAVSRTQKSEILNWLIANIKEAKSLWFTQTNWLTVSEFSELRADLREIWTSYNLAKKTLIKIAVKEALNLDLNLDVIPWQIWLICSNNDAISWLTKTNDYIKKIYNKKVTLQKIDWVACIIDWEIKGLEETKVIASMPSKETLLWRLVWSLQSPIASLARFFDSASKDIETKWSKNVWELKKEVKEEEKKIEKIEESKEEKTE